jgi:hypothetical protein
MTRQYNAKNCVSHLGTRPEQEFYGDGTEADEHHEVDPREARQPVLHGVHHIRPAFEGEHSEDREDRDAEVIELHHVVVRVHIANACDRIECGAERALLTW